MKNTNKNLKLRNFIWTVFGILFLAGIGIAVTTISDTEILTTGSVGIGIITPNESSILELNSTTKGFLAPRMTRTQRLAITNIPEGLEVHQTNNGAGRYVYNNNRWSQISGLEFAQFGLTSIYAVDTLGAIVPFNDSVNTYGITITNDGNFSLKANKTYSLRANLYATFGTGAGSTGLDWVDVSDNAIIPGSVRIQILAVSGGNFGSYSGGDFIYTPSSDIVIGLYVNDSNNNSNIQMDRSSVIITQID